MKTLTFELPHITVEGVSWGDESATKIIALHGWLDNAASYIPLSSHVSQYHLIAIDWPGHGFSSHRPSGVNYQLLDYVYDLYCLIDQQGWGKVHIVGHSLGAIVGAIFAATFPELVDRLVVIEALGPMVADANKTQESIRKSIIAQRNLVNKSKPVHPTAQSAVNARFHVSDFSLEIAKILVMRAIEPIAGGYTWRSDIRLRLISPWRMTEAQAQDVIASIKAKTLLIIGSNGLPMVKTSLQYRGGLIEDLTVVELVGGHHVHMEQPQLTWSAISSHLSL